MKGYCQNTNHLDKHKYNFLKGDTMKLQKVNMPKLLLVGLTTRTNNKNEMNPQTSKIAKLAGHFWANQMAAKIKNRVKTGVTYAVYTEFESDETGEYTYFIGEAVGSFDGQDLAQFNTLEINKSLYQKFTTDPGKIPNIVVSAWQKIWAMKIDAFEGKRTYVSDFEIYDERSVDLNNAIVDIYVGIKSKG